MLWVASVLLLLFVPTTTAAAAQWVHVEGAPGSHACAARLAGSDIDTTLMLNRKGQLILVVGRADWHASGTERIGLRIDNFTIDHLQATAFNNLLLVLIKDGAILNRLRVAKNLHWYLPSGTHHASVTGLGERWRGCGSAIGVSSKASSRLVSSCPPCRQPILRPGAGGTGCVFRSMPGRYSGACRAVVPGEVGLMFRSCRAG